MKIFNTDTQRMANITYTTNGYNSEDLMPELIANDKNVTWNDNVERYEASAATIKQWYDYVFNKNDCDELKGASLHVLPSDEVQSIEDRYSHLNIGDIPRHVMQDLVDVCHEAGYELIRYNDGGIAFVAL